MRRAMPVLREVADRLRTYGAADLVARIGEEFWWWSPALAWIPPASWPNACGKVAEQPVATPAGPVGVTISIGVAEAPPGSEAQALLRRADEALYRAKSNGRNRAETAPDEPEAAAAAAG